MKSGNIQVDRCQTRELALDDEGPLLFCCCRVIGGTTRQGEAGTPDAKVGARRFDFKSPCFSRLP